MARRFQKVRAADELFASNGKVSLSGNTDILIGESWAKFVDSGHVTELPADETIEEPYPSTSLKRPFQVETFTPAAAAPVTAEALGTGDGSTKTFTKTLAVHPLDPVSVVVKVAAASVATSDLNGRITGTGVSGTVDYTTGVITVTWDAAPAEAAALTLDYRRPDTTLVLATSMDVISSQGLVVMKNGTPMVHGDGADKYTVIDSKTIHLGTNANGTDLYTVVYL